MNISQIIFIITSFYCGRLSYMLVKNKYLESKRDELNSYRNELLKIESDLEAKDSQIRKKWQSMVDDISKYQASINGDTGKWSDWDDVYLRSWNSAEK